MRIILVVLFSIFLLPTAVSAIVIDITFPVEGHVSFYNDFNNPRSGMRTHNAIDILSDKMMPIVAPLNGVITFAPMEEPNYGFMLNLLADNGYSFSFIHINNDTPNTDDGMGGPEYAYAPGIRQGVRVLQGQHIAWVGDSGNAESTAPHLHFEMYDEHGKVLNPYETLLASISNSVYDPAVEQKLATSINASQEILPTLELTLCVSGMLIRTKERSTVYYCGADGGRYIFLNESVYYSWYKNFTEVMYVTTDEMSSIPLKGVVTYKPGVYLVKLQSIAKVYAVAHDSTLRWVVSAELAEKLYGSNWSTLVKDIPDGFFVAYQIGESVAN